MDSAWRRFSTIDPPWRGARPWLVCMKGRDAPAARPRGFALDEHALHAGRSWHKPCSRRGWGEEGRLCDQAILPRARAGSRHLSEKWGHGPYTALLAASCHARARSGLCIWEGWHRLRGEGTEKIHLSRPSVGARAVTLLGLAPSSRGEIFAPHQAKPCLDLD